MNRFLQIGSNVFHPLWMPLAGTLGYFLISPRFFPSPIVKAKLLAIAILTIFIPIIFFFLLKNMRLVKSISLKTAKERRIPLVFFCLLLLTILNYIIRSEDFPELYYFFSGSLYASLSALLFSIFNRKISLHLMGIAGMTTFFICLSVLYGTNLTFVISGLIFAIGWVASARLAIKAHNNHEIILGILCGSIPQLFLLIGPQLMG